MKTFKLEIEVSAQRVADLITCGFEGGVGYWARIVDYQKPTGEVVMHHASLGRVFKHVDWPLAEGGGVVIEEHAAESEGFDPEAGERTYPRHTLNLEAIARGLALFPKAAPRHYADWIAKNDDAETGDVFLQLCLLGEVRYG